MVKPRYDNKNRQSSMRQFIASGGNDQLMPASEKRVAFRVGINANTANYAPQGSGAAVTGQVITTQHNPHDWNVWEHGLIVTAPWFINAAIGTAVTILEVMED